MDAIRDILQEDYQMPGDAIRHAFSGIRTSSREYAAVVEKKLTNPRARDTHTVRTGDVIRDDWRSKG